MESKDEEESNAGSGNLKTKPAPAADSADSLFRPDEQPGPVIPHANTTPHGLGAVAAADLEVDQRRNLPAHDQPFRRDHVTQRKIITKEETALHKLTASKDDDFFLDDPLWLDRSAALRNLSEMVPVNAVESPANQTKEMVHAEVARTLSQWISSPAGRQAFRDWKMKKKKKLEMAQTKFKAFLLHQILPPHLRQDHDGRTTRLPKKALNLLQRLAENHLISVFNQFERIKKDIEGGHLPSCLVLGKPTLLRTDYEQERPVCHDFEAALKSYARECGVPQAVNQKFAPAAITDANREATPFHPRQKEYETAIDSLRIGSDEYYKRFCKRHGYKYPKKMSKQRGGEELAHQQLEEQNHDAGVVSVSKADQQEAAAPLSATPGSRTRSAGGVRAGAETKSQCSMKAAMKMKCKK
eukprot:g487.t1